MKYKWFLIFSIFSIWLNIGNGAIIGQEVCNCQSAIIRTPRISVPKTPEYRVIYNKIPGPNQYIPIKNACSCINTQVTPASIPRVEVDLTVTKTTPDTGYNNENMEPQSFGERGGAFFPECTCNTEEVSSGSPVVQDLPGPDGIDEPANLAENACCSSPSVVAVDPVSLMLAQAEANRCQSGVREDRLAFGQVAIPKDALPPSPIVSDVDEEGLYTLDKAIIELKTCKRYGQNAVASDTDALLALEEDAQPDDANTAGPNVNLPSYADVGYQTEKLSCAPLINGVSVPPASNTKVKVLYDSAAQEYSKMSPKWKSSCKKWSCDKCSSGKCSCDKCSCGKCSY